TLRGQLDYVTGLAFSPDGRRLVSTGTQNIKIWDAGDDAPPAPDRERAERMAAAWHRQQADACQNAQPPDWFGVAFHVSRLLDIGPPDARTHARRAGAEVELERWPEAVA